MQLPAIPKSITGRIMMRNIYGKHTLVQSYFALFLARHISHCLK